MPVYACTALRQRDLHRAALGERLRRRGTGNALIITGWARRGHPQKGATRLALELSAAAVRSTGVEESHVMVVIRNGPARNAVEGGQVLPEPGEERVVGAPG